ncbi:MAG: ArsR family transcriptional regulator [Bacteroidales bacterium]|nr:ArsR family transcriptional regulator [Bacteroidales bacterium]
MNELHENQKRLLKILEQNIDNPLTIRELKDELGFSSPSVVSHHIQQLEKKGYLKRNPNNPRDYQLLKNPDKPIVYLNQYGLAQCGPNGSILDGNPIDRIPIASRLLNFPAEEGFMLIAKGDSMEPQISEGDYIIAQKANSANNGDTIVCVYDEVAIIKKYYIHENQILLISINAEKYPPLHVSKYFKIEGIVKNVIKYNS